MAFIFKQANRYFKREKHFVNERIRAPEVRLIGSKGENIGVVSTQDALRRARNEELDLVLISEKANPPVAKILEYSKFLYEERKKMSAVKAKSHKSEIKEFIFGPTIGEGDLQVRIARTREFLLEGNKVKISVKFKGREMIYPDIGMKKIEHVINELRDVAKVEERDIKLKGNLITATFVKI